MGTSNSGNFLNEYIELCNKYRLFIQIDPTYYEELCIKEINTEDFNHRIKELGYDVDE